MQCPVSISWQRCPPCLDHPQVSLCSGITRLLFSRECLLQPFLPAYALSPLDIPGGVRMCAPHPADADAVAAFAVHQEQDIPQDVGLLQLTGCTNPNPG